MFVCFNVTQSLKRVAQFDLRSDQGTFQDRLLADEHVKKLTSIMGIPLSLKGPKTQSHNWQAFAAPVVSRRRSL